MQNVIINLSINKYIDYLKRAFSSILIKYINMNPIITTVIIYAKSIILLSIVNNEFFNTIKDNYFRIQFAPHLAIIILITSFGFIFKGEKRAYFGQGINILISILFICDISYFRATGTFLAIRYILSPNLFNPLNKSIICLKLVDILFIIDIPIYFLLRKRFYKKKLTSKRKTGIFILTFMLSLSTIIKFNLLIDKRDITNGSEALFRQHWLPKGWVQNMSPLGYHEFDTLLKIKEKAECYKMQKSGLDEVSTWINSNKEDLVDNKYKGIYSGKNLMFIQVESLDRLVINQKVDGQEITPNLNKLIKNSIYFDNIYEQNSAGGSSDCDLMVNTSVLPVTKGMTFFEFPDNKFTTLTSLLKKKNYSTMSSHPETDVSLNGFNWAEAHINALGFDKVYDSTQLSGTEKIYLGLSDKAYLNSVKEKVKYLKEPFYNYSVTVTTHGDFSVLPEKYKKMNLPQELNETVLGNYFQNFNYVDEQIGNFINDIESDENLKNTVFVIYGDHSSLHKSYHNKINNINLEGNWWKDEERRFPLIIYTPGQEPETISTYGGQIDIMPTIAYMMGIDRSEFENTTMGRVLVNTHRNSTILVDGTIKGEVNSEEERQHLSEAYRISDKYIRGNYLEWLEKQVSN